MNGYCFGCRSEAPLAAVGYSVTSRGVVTERRRCPRGHVTPQTIHLDPPPPPDDLARARDYAMGAAVGYAAGRRVEARKLAQAIKTLKGLGTPLGELRLMLGKDKRSLRRLLTGEYPGRGSGTYALAEDYWAGLTGGPRSRESDQP